MVTMENDKKTNNFYAMRRNGRIVAYIDKKSYKNLHHFVITKRKKHRIQSDYSFEKEMYERIKNNGLTDKELFEMEV